MFCSLQVLRGSRGREAEPAGWGPVWRQGQLRNQWGQLGGQQEVKEQLAEDEEVKEQLADGYREEAKARLRCTTLV